MAINGNKCGIRYFEEKNDWMQITCANVFKTRWLLDEAVPKNSILAYCADHLGWPTEK